MAQTNEPAPIGKRLARLRDERGLSAQDLADRLAGAGISRSVITNVETGRKRDLTATEVLMLAAALDVSVWALLLDTSDPWSVVELPGWPSAISDQGVTVAEAVQKLGDAFGSEVGDIPKAVTDMGTHAANALVALRRFTRRVVELEHEHTGLLERPPTREDILIPDGTIEDRPYLEAVRHEYRDALHEIAIALAARSWLEHSANANLAAIPNRVQRYLDSLRETVIELARFYGDTTAVFTLESVGAMNIPDMFFETVRLPDVSNGHVDRSPGEGADGTSGPDAVDFEPLGPNDTVDFD